MKYDKTLLLDSSYLPKNVISSSRAFVIYMKGNCEILKHHDSKFGLVRKDIDIFRPSVIRINNYVNVNYGNVPLNRVNVFKRDDNTCLYCGKIYETHKLTLDHVIPQCKGGLNTWDNLVTACKKCNNEKSDLSLQEWGKELPVLKRPHSLMLLKRVSYIPKNWEEFLFY